MGGPFYVYGNSITENQDYGVQFAESCSNSQVYENDIMRNSIGIELFNFPLEHSSIGTGNTVYRNNMVNNSRQVFVEEEWRYARNFENYTGDSGTDVVAWDNSKEGNYWSDYNSTDTNNNGIGDTPYIIDENNEDHFPLTQQVDISTASPPPSTSLSFLTTLIAGAAITLTIFVMILFFYFKKRKH